MYKSTIDVTVNVGLWCLLKRRDFRAVYVTYFVPSFQMRKLVKLVKKDQSQWDKYFLGLNRYNCKKNVPLDLVLHLLKFLCHQMFKK